MAKVNKPDAIKEMTGLAASASLASGPDNVPAMITNQQGAPQGPAMIKEGEFILSVEAVAAVGDGDHAKGVAILERIHNELRAKGAQMLQGRSLAALDMG